MARFLMVAVVAALSLVMWPGTSVADLPKPSVYPISWELKFESSKPQRIVVETPGASTPQAYWYISYRVWNSTDQERMFLPVIELVGEDGKLRRADKSVPTNVVDAIRKREGNKFIENSVNISGEMRIGPEEAKYGIAVWPEPAAEMGQFAILVGGLSGEYQRVKNAAGEEVILRKTLQLNFVVRGDEVYPGEDAISENPSEWIMR